MGLPKLSLKAPPLDESILADLEISPLDARRCISSSDFFDFESSYHLMNFVEKFKRRCVWGVHRSSSIPPNSNDIVHPVLLNDSQPKNPRGGSLCHAMWVEGVTFFSTWGSVPFGLSILQEKASSLGIPNRQHLWWRTFALQEVWANTSQSNLLFEAGPGLIGCHQLVVFSCSFTNWYDELKWYCSYSWWRFVFLDLYEFICMFYLHSRAFWSLCQRNACSQLMLRSPMFFSHVIVAGIGAGRYGEALILWRHDISWHESTEVLILWAWQMMQNVGVSRGIHHMQLRVQDALSFPLGFQHEWHCRCWKWLIQVSEGQSQSGQVAT